MTLSDWKTKLKENGSKAFGSGDELKEKKEKTPVQELSKAHVETVDLELGGLGESTGGGCRGVRLSVHDGGLVPFFHANLPGNHPWKYEGK